MEETPFYRINQKLNTTRPNISHFDATAKGKAPVLRLDFINTDATAGARSRKYVKERRAVNFREDGRCELRLSFTDDHADTDNAAADTRSKKNIIELSAENLPMDVCCKDSLSQDQLIARLSAIRNRLRPYARRAGGLVAYFHHSSGSHALIPLPVAVCRFLLSDHDYGISDALRFLCQNVKGWCRNLEKIEVPGTLLNVFRDEVDVIEDVLDGIENLCEGLRKRKKGGWKGLSGDEDQAVRKLVRRATMAGAKVRVCRYDVERMEPVWFL